AAGLSCGRPRRLVVLQPRPDLSIPSRIGERVVFLGLRLLGQRRVGQVIRPLAEVEADGVPDVGKIDEASEQPAKEHPVVGAKSDARSRTRACGARPGAWGAKANEVSDSPPWEKSRPELGRLACTLGFNELLEPLSDRRQVHPRR